MDWCTYPKLDGAVANLPRRHLLCFAGAFPEEAPGNSSSNCLDPGFGCDVDAPAKSGSQRYRRLLSKYR